MLVKVINKRGTTRMVEETQLAEYARKGYEKVAPKVEVKAPAPEAKQPVSQPDEKIKK